MIARVVAGLIAMIVHVAMTTERAAHRVVASVVMIVHVILMKTVLAVKILAPQHSVALTK
jgi:hypothetical protein